MRARRWPAPTQEEVNMLDYSQAYSGQVPQEMDASSAFKEALKNRAAQQMQIDDPTAAADPNKVPLAVPLQTAQTAAAGALNAGLKNRIQGLQGVQRLAPLGGL